MSTLSFKTKVGIIILRIISKLSRLFNLGSGSVIGGRLLTFVSKDSLSEMSAGKSVVLVSGTNGKTTTTNFISTILKGYGIEAATNALGANMTAGITSAIAHNLDAAKCVFEVDEHWLATIGAQTNPAVIVLLNLSRDQLDRTTEVRVIAKKWKNYLDSVPSVKVIANADDPLIAYCAYGHTNTSWLSGGNSWLMDARSCPNCGNNLNVDDAKGAVNYFCLKCKFTKPNVDYEVLAGDGSFSIESLSDNGGNLYNVPLNLPGKFNGLNAAFAIIATGLLGLSKFDQSATFISEVTDIAGRYSIKHIKSLDINVRMILAKNPAGWVEALKLISLNTDPAIFAINAEIPDGKDPSWLYDVPFEDVNSKIVLATGKRVLDLAVRLSYAGIEHEVVYEYDDLVKNLTLLKCVRGDSNIKHADLVANYSAFQDLIKVKLD